MITGRTTDRLRQLLTHIWPLTRANNKYIEHCLMTSFLCCTLFTSCESDLWRYSQITVNITGSTLEQMPQILVPVSQIFNPLRAHQDRKATDHNTTIWRLVHWSLIGGLFHLVQRWGAWAGFGFTQFPPRYTKCTYIAHHQRPVDRWTVTFATARRGLGGFGSAQSLCSLYQMYIHCPLINGQSTNFILFDVAL